VIGNDGKTPLSKAVENTLKHYHGFENNSPKNSPLLESATILACAGSSHFKTRGSAIDNRSEVAAGSNPAGTRQICSHGLSNKAGKRYFQERGRTQIFYGQNI